MTESTQVAKKTADIMKRNDKLFQNLGANLETIKPGTAIVSLVVQEKHSNGHGFCHGGVLFSLADATFGFACNSYNRKSVAKHCDITFISPVKIGIRLTAEAIEVKKFGKSAIYDVKIQNDQNDLVAIFRGQAREISGTIY